MAYTIHKRMDKLMVKRSCLLLATVLAMSFVSSAAGEEPPAVNQAPTGKRWGVETSVVFPVVHIYELHGSYRFWSHGEALAGFALQRWSEDDFDDTFPPGQAEAYTLLMGYRQFIWKGLHAEVMLFPAYNRFHSHVDNKVYSGPELWVESYVGYTFRIEVGGVNLVIVPQMGLGFAVWHQTKWPKEDEYMANAGMTAVPNLLVGAEF
ncbi:MAG: hypothetical protein V2A73_13315 [Pseudomonadota bacterium]